MDYTLGNLELRSLLLLLRGLLLIILEACNEEHKRKSFVKVKHKTGPSSSAKAREAYYYKVQWVEVRNRPPVHERKKNIAGFSRIVATGVLESQCRHAGGIPVQNWTGKSGISDKYPGTDS